MPLFKYWALDRAGKRLQATIDAANSQEVKELIKNKGLIPSKIVQVAQGGGNWWVRLFEKKVDLKTKVLFTRQLSVLLKAGIPLLDAIGLLIEQFEGRMQRILVDIRDDLKEGKGLADSMGNYPKVFNNVYIQLVRAGEASGGLEKILDRLTLQLERSEEIKKKISSAMAGPLFTLSFAFVIVIGASVFILPTIVGTLSDLGNELPGVTQMMMDFSYLITNYWLPLIFGFIIVFALFRRWKATASGRYRYDQTLLRLPFVSSFTKIRAVVAFSQTLGMLLDAGVNLSAALDIVCSIVNNSILSGALREAKENIIRKGKIAKFLKQTGIFPPIAFYMIRTGEESGNLPEMLLQVGNDYEQELEDTVDKMAAAANPLMTLLITGIVLLIVLALFLPILEMSNMPEI